MRVRARGLSDPAPLAPSIGLATSSSPKNAAPPKAATPLAPLVTIKTRSASAVGLAIKTVLCSHSTVCATTPVRLAIKTVLCLHSTVCATTLVRLAIKNDDTGRPRNQNGTVFAQYRLRDDTGPPRNQKRYCVCTVPFARRHWSASQSKTVLCLHSCVCARVGLSAKQAAFTLPRAGSVHPASRGGFILPRAGIRRVARRPGPARARRHVGMPGFAAKQSPAFDLLDAVRHACLSSGW